MKSLANEQGKTTLMVTHNPEELSMCDKVAVFATGGSLCYFGKPGDLMGFFSAKEIVSIYRKVEENPTEWTMEWMQRCQLA